MAGMLIMFFSAGAETTVVNLAGVLDLLGKEKSAREMVEKDLLSTLLEGDWKNIEKLSEDSINWDRLSKLDQFIKEAQRLAVGLLFFFLRVCTKTHKLGGITIKKGTIIALPIWFYHRSSKNFENPDQFDMERFSPENDAKIAKRAYAPFGQGKRACIGMEVGKATMRSMIATLLSLFEVEKDPNFTGEWVLEGGFQMKEVNLRIRPRKN